MRQSIHQSVRGLALVLGLAFVVNPVLAAENPYLAADETWISLSGTAVDIGVETFSLDYGQGVVTVEMDDWDWYDETSGLLEGDKVTVYGEVDDDLYESTSIEASSVYVDSLGSYFYASDADEEYEDDYDYWVDVDPVVIGEMTVRGTVTGVDGREFTIDKGKKTLTVDTVMMAYNPVDDKGYQNIDVGDYVKVTGTMDSDLWETHELMADSIVTLIDD